MKRLRYHLGPWSLLALSLCSLGAEPSGRPRLELNDEWEFRLDPRDEGRDQRWFAPGVSFPRTAHVPGAWNAQGIGFETDADLKAYEQPAQRSVIAGPGSETNKLHHVFPGPAWYRRTVVPPASWAGKHAWLHFGGAHRDAEVWVNGNHVGRHIGYVVPFQFDVTRWIQPGAPASIVVRVDARRNREEDPLMGCVDTLDFLFVQWGGLHREVHLEATPNRWVENVFVLPRVAAAAAEVRVALGAVPDSQARKSLLLRVAIQDPTGNQVAQIERSVETQDTSAVVSLSIPNPRLWTPDTPDLYRTRVSLLSEGNVIDTAATRFGMREFQVSNGRFLLNGNPIFLRGYGDDCIYPNTIAPPTDREEYRRRFRVIKDYGFNYARHHSWCPPEEYLDVADEMGVLIQPEFPQAYRWELPTSPAARELALRLWRDMIVTHRNHPSIVAWCMGNELYDSFPDAVTMYQQAKDLDPSRLVIDSDGVSRKPRETLDFWVWQFSENSLGYLNEKYRFEPAEKPVVAHEMGYFVTLPDLTQRSLFGQGLRPYWLDETRDLVEKKSIGGAYSHWLANSYQLQAECLKINMEAARRSDLQGYSCWLFQDYPWCAEGVVDMFFRPKAFPGVTFQQFNGPTVLLLDHDRRTFRSGERVEMKILVSSDVPADKESARFSWRIRNESGEILASDTQSQPWIPSFKPRECMTVRATLPQTPIAHRLFLEADLVHGSRRATNAWKLWMFPTPSPAPGSVRFAEDGPLARAHPSASVGAPHDSRDGLYVTSQWDDATLDFLEKGGRVLLLAPEVVLPTVASGFRPAGWDPSAREANLGTVFDPAHPALRGMPSDGWCDLQFYSLIEGGQVVLLDELNQGLSPIVRCIDMPQRLWNKAFLFEARVGKGRLLVSGFHFGGTLAARDPAAAWFATELIRYAQGPEFDPTSELSPTHLKPHPKKP